MTSAVEVEPHSKSEVLPLAFAVGTLGAIFLIPRSISPSAGAHGYDPALAHSILIVSAFLCIGAAALLARASYTAPDSVPATGRGLSPRATALAAAAIALLVFLLYAPPALARYGPYGEDKYFLSVLQRMQVGQRPYADFEFIYGPLLAYPAHAWMDVFGYSLRSYYSLLAIVEAGTFAAVAIGLAAVAGSTRRFVLALAVAAVLLVNDNLGLSWIALRRLLPVIVLLAHAAYAHGRRWPLAAGLLGIQCVTSVEYALACILAIAGGGVVESLAARGPAPVLRTLRTIVVAIALAGLLAFAMMRRGVVDWLTATWNVMALRGGGEAGFEFGLSVNAFAVLALLFLACARFGAGLPGLLRGPVRLSSADRFFLAALAYAAVAARSGLARSDMYHLVPPVLALITMAILPVTPRAFPAGPRARRAAVAATALICITYAPGLVGAGRIWAEGLGRGVLDLAAGRAPSGVEIEGARGPAIGAERTTVPPHWVEVGEYMGATVAPGAPVVYYGSMWGLDRYIGVPKPAGIYATDDYLVSDEAGFAVRDYLAAHPDAVVLIDRSVWDALASGGPAPVYTSMFWLGGRRSLLVRSLEHWSSSHYGVAVVNEQARKQERWDRTVGVYVREHYIPARVFDSLVVLRRHS